MGDLPEQLANADLDSQFLPQFPHEALLERFALLALATGKFPQTAEMRIRVALCDQHLSVAENQAGGDVNDLSRVEGRGSRARGSSVRLSTLDSRPRFHRPTLL